MYQPAVVQLLLHKNNKITEIKFIQSFWACSMLKFNCKEEINYLKSRIPALCVEEQSTCWVQLGSCVPLRSSLPSQTHPTFFCPGINDPVAECEGPCCEMRRFPVTNRDVPGVGPTGIRRGEKGVRVYCGSVWAMWVWRNEVWNGKKMTELLLDVSHSGNQDNQKKPSWTSAPC